MNIFPKGKPICCVSVFHKVYSEATWIVVVLEERLMRSSVVDPNRVYEPENKGGQYEFPFQAYRTVPRFSGQPPAPYTSFQQDNAATATEGWFALLLLAVAVYSVVYSVVVANWVEHSIVLFWSPAIGLLMGIVVARTPKLPQSILHLAACLLGHWFSVWLTSVIAFHVSWLLLLGGLRAVVIGGLGAAAMPNGDEMVFFFYLSFLCFFLGYFGSWLIYRARLPWLVAFVYCSIMLVNLNYVKQDLLFLFVLLLCSLLLLIARVQLATQILQWKREGLHTDRSWMRNITVQCMQVASVFTLIIMLLSPLLPIMDQSQSGKVFWDRLGNVWTNIINGHIPVQNPGSLVQPYQSPSNFFGDQLTITGSVHLPIGEVLNYTSSVGPSYLEGFTYNQFDGHTWLSSLNSSNSHTFTAGTTLQTDVVRGDYTQISTDVNVVQPPENTKHYIFGPAQPTSFDVSTIIYNDGTTTTWTQESPLTPGERYQVLSTAPPAVSGNAQYFSNVPLPADSIDAWHADHNYNVLAESYLQVPYDLSANVLQRTRQWTSGATNTYDALKMLEAHLSDQNVFTYSIDNTPVPNNVDVVDWLLQTHKGYCTYYASAMSVMARQLGIPTRVVSGFSHGHYDAKRKVWVVRGDDAHSWVQAYLPGYGWVSFDPTPGFAPAVVKGSQPKPQPTSTQAPTKPVPTVTPPAKRPISPPKLQQKPVAQSASSNPLTRLNPSLLAGLSVTLLLLSLLFFLVALGRYWWRGLYANSTFVSGMYWRLCYLARFVGLGPKEWQTPYEYGRMLSSHIPQKEGMLWRLTDMFVRDRWGTPYQAPHDREIKDAERLWPSIWRMLGQLAFRKIKK